MIESYYFYNTGCFSKFNWNYFVLQKVLMVKVRANVKFCKKIVKPPLRPKFIKRIKRFLNIQGLCANFFSFSLTGTNLAWHFFKVRKIPFRSHFRYWGVLISTIVVSDFNQFYLKNILSFKNLQKSTHSFVTTQ